MNKYLTPIFEINELKPLLKEKWDGKKFDLVIQHYKIPINVKWVYKNGFEGNCLEEMINQGMEPNTTLVLYKEKVDDNCVLSMLRALGDSEMSNICLFIEDMTIEKLATMYDKIVKMKAFL